MGARIWTDGNKSICVVSKGSPHVHGLFRLQHVHDDFFHLLGYTYILLPFAGQTDWLTA